MTNEDYNTLLEVKECADRFKRKFIAAGVFSSNTDISKEIAIITEDKGYTFGWVHVVLLGDKLMSEVYSIKDLSEIGLSGLMEAVNDLYLRNKR